VKEIAQWLNNKDTFVAGIFLLKKHCQDGTIIKKFEAKTSASYDKLYAELVSIYRFLKKGNTKPIIKKEIPILDLNKIDIENTQKKDLIIDSRTFLDLETLAKTSYKELMNKRAVLFSNCSFEKQFNENSKEAIATRKQLALDIVKDQYPVNENYFNFNQYKETGVLPNVEIALNDVPDNPILLHRKYDNERKNLNKLLNKEPNLERIKLIENKRITIKKLKDAIDKLTK
jgi:hypothetical protein